MRQRLDALKGRINEIKKPFVIALAVLVLSIIIGANYVLVNHLARKDTLRIPGFSNQASTVPIQIPSNIASDCSTDVTSQINNWIASTPNNSTLQLRQNACYRTNGTIQISDKNGITFDGNGATFKREVDSSLRTAFHTSISSSQNITMQNLNIEGLNTGRESDGFAIYNPSVEGQHGIRIEKSSDVAVQNITASNVHGDGVYLRGNNNVTVRNLTIDGNGRMGLAITRGDNTLIDNVKILNSAYFGMDLEPNLASEKINGVEIRNSYINSRRTAFASLNGPVVDNVYIHDNVVKHALSFVYSRSGWPADTNCQTNTPRQNWRIENNQVNDYVYSYGGAGIVLCNTVNAKISGNIMPSSRAEAVRLEKASGSVSVVGNYFEGENSAYTADSGTTSVSACGNKLSEDGGYNQPVPCPDPVGPPGPGGGGGGGDNPIVIHGYKVIEAGAHNQVAEPASSQTVTINGAFGITANPYEFRPQAGGNYTMRVTTPAGYTAGYTLCYTYDPNTCHDQTPTRGDTVQINNAVPNGDYDLWWHFTPINANAPLKAPTIKTVTHYLRNSYTSGSVNVRFTYGNTSYVPLYCDWNGDGKDTVGMYDNGRWYIKNSNTSGAPDINFTYGGPGNIPVCGDWNGDGRDTVGVVSRKSDGTMLWSLRNTNTAGPTDESFAYGVWGEYKPVVGDWNGDGRDTVGVIMNEDNKMKWLLRNTNSQGAPDSSFLFGQWNQYKPVVGDWNGDGKDTVGVIMNEDNKMKWLLRNTNSGGGADRTLIYGLWSYEAVVGDYDGNNTDTPGVVTP